MTFRAYPKTPRLFKPMTISEKLDGTNACVVVVKDALSKNDLVDNPIALDYVSFEGEGYFVMAQSRNRMLRPDADNAGFAAWVRENAAGLVETLGEGYHYGEWYGQGIQRKYGLDHKRFALFNVNRYGDLDLSQVENLETVPVLYEGPFDTQTINRHYELLMECGSVAVPGYTNPEGIIVFHSASQQVYKVTDNGDQPKWQANELKAVA